MAELHTDIDRMIMQAQYLLAMNQSPADTGMTDMERKQYQDQIKELIQTVKTLLDANVTLGEKQKESEEKARKSDARIAELEAQVDKLTGELKARRRKIHGKTSEKKSGKKSVDKGQTKDDGEEDYIENEGQQPQNSEESSGDTSSSDSEATNPKDDLSNRPDHYNTMKAEVCVVHECDLEKVKALGLTFLHYTRPVDQFDRISMIRQDRYRYVWVRDKEGREFAFFVPKESDVEQRYCRFVDESKYDNPSIVPHTSGTSSMLSKEFLGEFKGTLMTDAYAAYLYFNKLKDCTHVCCWSHVRRIFVSAFRDYKDALAQKFIDWIGLLYKVEVESQVLGRSENEIVKYRGLEAIPVLNDLYQEATLLLRQYEQQKVKLSIKLHQALTYMTNHWEELKGYTEIGTVQIDNNCCERAVRPFTNLRKNFGGFSSERGARVAATYLTFVETCKLMAKAPLDFFRGFFDMVVADRRDYSLMVKSLLC